jgi:hypothetical protein
LSSLTLYLFNFISIVGIILAYKGFAEFRNFKNMATFPFGWVRGIEKDNWQILWDSETKIIYVKGASSKRVIHLGHSSSWEEAKTLADRVGNEPGLYMNFDQMESS